MTYEQGKALVESLFLASCPNCHGEGKVRHLDNPDGSFTRCPAGCVGGKVVSGLGEAFLEFLGDYLESKADANHSHYIS